MSESDIHISDVSDPSWKYKKIPPVQGTSTPMPIGVNADLHVAPDTPIKVNKSGNYCWLTIGHYPSQVTVHLNGTAVDNLLFALEEFRIVRHTVDRDYRV